MNAILYTLLGASLTAFFASQHAMQEAPPTVVSGELQRLAPVLKHLQEKHLQDQINEDWPSHMDRTTKPLEI